MADIEALKIAVAALYAALSEEQQNETTSRIMHSVHKHDLPGEDERRAVEILHGY